MIEIRYRLKFDGDEADRHRLPAHQGSQSIEGMAWALSLLCNYAASGEIRHRGRLDDRIQLFVTPAQRGSYTTDIIAIATEPQNIFLTTIVGTYAVATLTDAINGLIKHAYKRVCGLIDSDEKIENQKLERLPSGDIEAVIDAIEPSVKRAHSAINSGADSLTFQRARTPIITMDGATKEFINTNIIVPGITRQTVSIGALNVNSGNGRAYLPETGKTVPFSVVKEPANGTYGVLSQSLNHYARGRDSQIYVDCREVLGVDGRTKKLIIQAALNIVA